MEPLCHRCIRFASQRQRIFPGQPQDHLSHLLFQCLYLESPSLLPCQPTPKPCAFTPIQPSLSYPGLSLPTQTLPPGPLSSHCLNTNTPTIKERINSKELYISRCVQKSKGRVLRLQSLETFMSSCYECLSAAEGSQLPLFSGELAWADRSCPLRRVHSSLEGPDNQRLSDKSFKRLVTKEQHRCAVSAINQSVWGCPFQL